MPKVQVTAGSGSRGADLSAALKPIQEVTADIKTGRTTEFATKSAEWAAEKARLEVVNEKYNLDYQTALDQMMEAEKAKGGSFNTNTATKLREMAKEIANAKAVIGMGQTGLDGQKYFNTSREEALNAISANNRALDAMAANAGPIAALNDKFQASAKLKDGDIGKIVYDGSGNVADLAEIVQDIATNSQAVTYEVDANGSSYYKKVKPNGDEIKIPIEAINKIMTLRS